MIMISLIQNQSRTPFFRINTYLPLCSENGMVDQKTQRTKAFFYSKKLTNSISQRIIVRCGNSKGISFPAQDSGNFHASFLSQIKRLLMILSHNVEDNTIVGPSMQSRRGAIKNITYLCYLPVKQSNFIAIDNNVQCTEHCLNMGPLILYFPSL